MPTRKPGQSQLDYLWENYGSRFVSDKLESDSIPSGELLQSIVQDINDSSITDFNVINGQLIGYNKKGERVSFVNLSDLGKVPISFQKRYITQEDIDNGCTYKKGTPVYSLLFSDKTELIAKIDEYQGDITNSIALEVSGNTISGKLRIDNGKSVVLLKETVGGIVADLKISSDDESVQLTKEFDGLKAKILLDNEGRTLKFKYLTLSDYLAIEEPDSTTIYFIKGKKYFYFGKYAVGTGETNLDNYYTKDEIDAKLKVLDPSDTGELLLQVQKNTKDLLKLNGPVEEEGSVLNIISNQIQTSLSWEEIN